MNEVEPMMKGKTFDPKNPQEEDVKQKKLEINKAKKLELWNFHGIKKQHRSWSGIGIVQKEDDKRKIKIQRTIKSTPIYKRRHTKATKTGKIIQRTTLSKKVLSEKKNRKEAKS